MMQDTVFKMGNISSGSVLSGKWRHLKLFIIRQISKILISYSPVAHLLGNDTCICFYFQFLHMLSSVLWPEVQLLLLWGPHAQEAWAHDLPHVWVGDAWEEGQDSEKTARILMITWVLHLDGGGVGQWEGCWQGDPPPGAADSCGGAWSHPYRAESVGEGWLTCHFMSWPDAEHILSQPGDW